MKTLFEKMKLTPSTGRPEDAPAVQAVRMGLVLCIPMLLAGSVALVLRNLPIAAYTSFIESFAGGLLAYVFNVVNGVTFGLLSVFISFTVSLVYTEALGADVSRYTPPLVSMACFAILSGLGSPSFNIEAFGVKGMFTAIVTALLVTRLYLALLRVERLKIRLYSDGSDALFNSVLAGLLPFALTLATVAVFNLLLTQAFSTTGLHELFIRSANTLFANMGRSLLSTVLFVLLSSLLWFFGVHGSDVLEEVSLHIFNPGLEINAALAAAGKAPTEIFTRGFIDNFVLMGGCGAAICLLIAILLFVRRRNLRSLAYMAAPSMLFNINEIMIFGLPVVFNTSFFWPFVLSPLVCLFSSWLAMSTGLVPMLTATTSWTTPVLWSGYITTGSLRGSLLQLFNIVLCVLLYRPFVIRYEKKKNEGMKHRLTSLVKLLEDAERDGTEISLTTRSDDMGELARLIASELRSQVQRNEIKLFYQPQYDTAGRCVSCEALLRVSNETIGNIYPPLVVKLASESGFLPKLEECVFKAAASDLKRLRAKGLNHVSVNVTSATLTGEGFERFIEGLIKEHRLRDGELCIEITEQMTLLLDNVMEKRLHRLRAMGCSFSIDDFSMGHTSLNYLKTRHFSEIKLDGSLVRGLKDNERCADIISSIVYLSRSLNFSVLAEYVETADDFNRLCALGVTRFQGYFFARALPIEELEAHLESDSRRRHI